MSPYMAFQRSNPEKFDSHNFLSKQAGLQFLHPQPPHAGSILPNSRIVLTIVDSTLRLVMACTKLLSIFNSVNGRFLSIESED